MGYRRHFGLARNRYDGRHFAFIAGVVRSLARRLLEQDVSGEVRGGFRRPLGAMD